MYIIQAKAADEGIVESSFHQPTLSAIIDAITCIYMRTPAAKHSILVKLASQVRDISLKQTQMDELTNIYGIKNHDYKILLRYNSFLSNR